MIAVFDFDGVLSEKSMQTVCKEMTTAGVECLCVTSRSRRDRREPEKVCEELGISLVCIGDLIDQHLILNKADYIKMKLRFREDEQNAILFDNDPNEIIAAMKQGITAVLVPSWLTEELFDA